MTRFPAPLLTKRSAAFHVVWAAALLLLAISVHARAQELVLPSGLELDPPSSLDLTYQLIPAYDEQEKVIAGWNEDKLQYFLTVVNLPPGWTDPNKYFQGLVRDMRASGRSVEVLHSGQYKSASSLNVWFIEMQSISPTQTKPLRQVAHFLTDGKSSFLAIAVLTDDSAKDRMLGETALLLQSAKVSARVTAVTRAETPYFGTWQWKGPAGDGGVMTGTITLSDDLSFKAIVTKESQQIFSATGVWSVSGNRIRWTYLYSAPELPADEKEDEDEILSLEGGRLLLRSKLSGKDRAFFKQSSIQ